MTDYVPTASVTTSGEGEHAQALVNGDSLVLNAGINLTATGANADGVFSGTSEILITLLSGSHVASVQGTGITAGFGSQIQIAAEASVSGKAFGLLLKVPSANSPQFNAASTISNFGAISGDMGVMFGAESRSAADTLVNYGLIKGNVGAGVQFDGSGIVNNSGRIEGGIIATSGGLITQTIINSGIVLADANNSAINVGGGSGSRGEVINTGHIKGDVIFGNQSNFMPYVIGDLYDGRGGTIEGMIDLRAGHDRAYGGAGAETFKSGSGNDTIDGGGGNDIALYDGARADYDVTTVDGVTTVAYKMTGGDGTDTLTHVRFLKFEKDGTTLMLSNAAPAQVGLSASAVAENTPAGTTVATVSATDADGDAVSFALSDPTGTFKLDGTSLVLLKALDYETGPHAYELTLTATDAYGLARSETVTVTVTDVADTPAGGGGGSSGGGGNPSGPVALSLRGTARADRLTGADGNDVIKGLAGNDVLKGLSGNDKLYGGAGKDVLTGGKGQDIFVFDAKFNKKTNLDKITDFNVKDDTLWLENSLFKANKSLYAAIKKGSEAKPAKMASKFFTVGDKAKDANDFFIYDKKKGVLSYDADGSGSKAAVEIATLKKGLKLTEKDFFFV